MRYFELNEPVLTDELKKFIMEKESEDKSVEKVVLDIQNNIINNGFDAVKEYSKKFDNYDLNENNFRVSDKGIDELAKKIDPDLSKSLEIAVKRVKYFHENELVKSFEINDDDDNRMGQRIVPLDAAAIYIPGGGALYPSTLYMTAIPAIIAGVKRIVLLSPPRTFKESPAVARLIQLLGIKEVYRIGGAQSIFAAAYGAGILKPVDKIAGPGNIFVAKAKQMVYGKVDIDMIAGPSEILVIADTDKNEDIPLIAADLLSQAEHGPAGWAGVFVIGTDKDYLDKIRKETYRQANELPNKDIAVKSLDNRGIIIKCSDRIAAVKISNLLAPEHLELFSDDPYPLLDIVKNAGSVFVGKYTPESVGDYLGGPNHVLPTAGTARFFSPLGVYDYQKRFSWIQFSEKSLKKYTCDIANIARSEGLEAHARSAEIRLK